MKTAVKILMFLLVFSSAVYAQDLSKEFFQDVKQGKIDAVKALITKGVNVNVKDADGRTPLMFASASGYLDIVKYLVDNNANVNAKDKNEVTAFMFAVAYNKGTVGVFLLNNGAEINAKDCNGWTPLMFAAENGCIDAVPFLLSNGADIYARNKKGQIALDIAQAKASDPYNQAGVVWGFIIKDLENAMQIK